MKYINSSRARVCPCRLCAAVDRRDYVVALELSGTPQNRHVSFDAWVRNLHAELPVPLALESTGGAAAPKEVYWRAKVTR
jgi:hypothetical protein